MGWHQLVIASVLAMATSGSLDSPQTEAEKLAKRYLDHLAANVPVGGTFEIVTEFDREWLRRFQNAMRSKWRKEGKEVKFEPDRAVQHFNWAWDGVRELHRTFPHPEKRFGETFYRSPEAFLEEMEPNNFNLNKPRFAPGNTPATFYFLIGRRTWPDFFGDCSLEIAHAPAGATPGSVILVAQSAREQVRILISTEQGTLQDRQWFIDGKLDSQVTVEEFGRSSDHRLFPSKARMTVFDHETGKPIRCDTLKALELRFPTTGAEADHAFAMSLPAGTVVHDQMLNQTIRLNRATPVEQIVAGEIGPEIVLDKTVLPERSGPQLWWVVTASIAALVLGALFVLAKRLAASKHV